MHFKFFNKLFLFENDKEVHCVGTGVTAINDSKLVMTKVGKYKLAQGSLIHTGNNWARLGAPGPQSRVHRLGKLSSAHGPAGRRELHE